MDVDTAEQCHHRQQEFENGQEHTIAWFEEGTPYRNRALLPNRKRPWGVIDSSGGATYDVALIIPGYHATAGFGNVWSGPQGFFSLWVRYWEEGIAMKLGILKTDTVRPEWVPEFGEYPDMFVRLLRAQDASLEFEVYDVERGEYPRDIDEVDGYLITGSKSSVYDDKPWIPPLMEFVRELNARQKKLVGICFGHQLIAQALGGKTEKSARGWGVGLHRHRFTSTPEWHDHKALDLTILVSHQDQVSEKAVGSMVLAGSEFCENAVCQVGKHILTFQGHPEFVPEYSREIMEFRRQMIGEEVYATGVASLAGTHEGDRVAGWVINFLAS
jgi:GMP synthase-like glutamine amidotransferase